MLKLEMTLDGFRGVKAVEYTKWNFGTPELGSVFLVRATQAEPIKVKRGILLLKTCHFEHLAGKFDENVDPKLPPKQMP